VPGDFVSLYMM